MAENCPEAPGAAFESGPLAGLKKWHYGTIVADPPWSFKTYTERDQGLIPARGDQPYLAMTHEELVALPVRDLAAKDCVLHMWTISSHIDQTMKLAAEWGFAYKSLGVVWVKTQKGDPEIPKMGKGKWFRQEAEVSLLFTRGKPARLDAGVRQVILEPAREHSRKPDTALDRFEALSAGPYCELFSRASRTGWDQMGNEKGKFDRKVLAADDDGMELV
jgi:N6-adenosine-specific RNA methylase IME4